MNALNRTAPSPEELDALNRRLEAQSPQDVLRYALDRFFPHVALACSFGAEDMALWDMMYRINPRASLFYLDTDFLFPETCAVRDRLMARYAVVARAGHPRPAGDHARTTGGTVRRPVVEPAARSMLPDSKGRAVDRHSETLRGMGHRHSTRPGPGARPRRAG